MEAVMGVCNGGDVSSGGGSSESTVVSKEELVVEQLNHPSRHHHNHHQNIAFEVSDDSELELGLGLSLGSKNHKQIPRIFTAKDFTNNSNNTNNNGSSPSSASSCSSLGLRPPSSSSAKNISPVNNHNASSGTKRAVSPTAVSQVVGWPPIRAYRMNSMVNQAKSVANEESEAEFDEMKRKDVMYGAEEKGNAKERVPHKSCLFVKVNMDGVAIGRKVDLNAHSSYDSLGLMLEEMFTNGAVEKSNGEELMLMPKMTRPSKLLDGSSDFVLTYEDKDGDWMLVGDVPWGMFLSSVKRLRIMRTSEANGLEKKQS
ncbi:auxin-responsive protein IAA13 isoform X2 [Spinacia oleracea]|uniref:Auxin-responsive protein n=1 Tax=Spinacia oleracea TaxID=3562 RepID=A0ABM3QV53_SPIOL|nr:auxin-responsive protein IAA13-like isoform X2 [Spinacia oleracea]